VDPPVLTGVLTDEGLDGSGVLGRDPGDWVFLIRPFFREDDALDADVEEKPIAHAAAVTNDHRHVLGDRCQGDAFVGAGLTPEEIDEDALVSGVLIGDESQADAFFRGLGHEAGGTALVDDLLPLAFTDGTHVMVEMSVVQGPSDTVDLESKQAQEVARDLEVTIVTGDQDESAALLHHPLGPLDVRESGVAFPVVRVCEFGCEQAIDTEHGDLLEAAAASLGDPASVFRRKAGAKIVRGSSATFPVKEPQHLSKEAGQGQYRIDRKKG